MKKFTKKSNKIAKDTNLFLGKLFSNKSNQSYLSQPMKYGIFSGGKRFRSTIIVNTGKIFNINYKKLIALGAAVECIHSYSLIHDDLPSMDDDNYRRGKLSTHKKFNEFTAILTGNSLLTLAFEILSSKNLNFSPKVKNELIESLAIYSGHLGLAGGQYVDLTYENIREAYLKIFNRFGLDYRLVKADSGAIGGSDSEEFHILADSGEDLLAFSDKSDYAINAELLVELQEDQDPASLEKCLMSSV